MKRSKRRLALLLGVVLVFFFGLVIYMIQFQIREAPGLRADARNQRNWVDETKFGRGQFLDRNGHVIVERGKEKGVYVRWSNHPHMYSQLIGYNSDVYGKTGLEAAYNAKLLNLPGDNPIAQLRGTVLAEGTGNDVQLTIDNDLQLAAYQALEGHKGAAVALDANTGAVLMMVSLPSYNVNNLKSDWSVIVEDPDDRLFPRATRGLYAPGSVMKPITALALLKTGMELSYDDRGETTVDGHTYHNFNDRSYGKIGLTEALVHSSNVYFIDKAKEIAPSVLRETADAVGFNQKTPFELKTAVAKAPYQEGMAMNLKVSNSFGQGDVLATPLQMVSAYQALANGGKRMQPFVVQNLVSPSGDKINETEPKVLSEVDAEAAETIRKALVATAADNGLTDRVGVAVGGKTGTAQTANKSTHAWTIAFAPAKKPRVVIGLVLEEDGRTGGEAALPLVAQLLRQALDLDL